ncbi:MAG: PaaI family thioesterase [Phycisphaerales bacterium]
MSSTTVEERDEQAVAVGQEPGAGTRSAPGQVIDQPAPAGKKTFFERVEAYISRLSTRSNFWHRVCSLIWLPIAYRSGIRMKRLDTKTFTAVLPFRRFNRNWYNAMAGAALLANSEIAGGMYVFGVCGADYTVVCKELRYRFLRPCFGPAVYRVTPMADLDHLVKDGGEFNIDVELDICQQLKKPGEKELRVGKCFATFHVTPKQHAKSKRVARRMKQRARGQKARRKAAKRA